MIERASRRREFLGDAGMVLSAAMVQACASGRHALPSSVPGVPSDPRRPSPEASATPIVQALAIALNAPSSHNVQPWLFELEGPRRARLRVDETRLLPATDPPARQIHISCGCLLEAFVQGAPLVHHGGTVEPFPDGSYVLGDVGRAPVARLVLEDGAPPAPPLAPYIFQRQTSRLVYEGPEVTPSEFAVVLAAAALRHSKVRLIGQDDLPPYLELLDRAMTVESTTRATNEETRRWIRFSSKEAEELRDGLTFEANGITGMSSTFARWFLRDTEESWNAERTVNKGLKVFRRGLYSARGLVLLETTANEYADHVEAGRDVYRLMLALTKHGFVCHPCNQVLQEYAEMDDTRREFEALCGTSAPAKVQMILRIGRSGATYRSYRRKWRDFMAFGN